MAEKDIYVLVCDRDTYKPEDGGRPIVFEQYVDRDCASLEEVERLQKRPGNKYGNTRIGKVEFIDT